MSIPAVTIAVVSTSTADSSVLVGELVQPASQPASWTEVMVSQGRREEEKDHKCILYGGDAVVPLSAVDGVV